MDKLQAVLNDGRKFGTTPLNNGNLKIENSGLNLSTIFENYQGIGENYLDLNTFIDDYKKYEKSILLGCPLSPK